MFIPLAVYVTLPNGGDRESAPSWIRRRHQRLDEVLRHLYQQSFGRLNRAYGRWLDLFLRRRADLLLAGGLRGPMI